MKKRGFTLAEVLIAMALVGVISALTLPTFVSNSRNRANAAKLSSTVNAVETAFQTMMASQAEDDFSQTSFGQDPTESNLSEFLKLNGNWNNLSEAGYETDAPFKSISNTGTTVSCNRVYLTKNGAIIGINTENRVNRNEERVKSLGGSVTASLGTFVIDVNGTALPNKWGRDAFYFSLGNDGMLYPAGSLNFSILQRDSDDQLHSREGGVDRCNNGVFTVGCTARLIENNYEVDF